MTSTTVLVIAGIATSAVGRGLNDAAALSSPNGITVNVFDNLACLPHYSETLENQPLPRPVAALRDAAVEAHAAMVLTNYYGHIPATVHNAIDWLTRRWNHSALHRKPLAVIGPMEDGYSGVWSRHHTEESRRTGGTRVIEPVTVATLFEAVTNSLNKQTSPPPLPHFHEPAVAAPRHRRRPGPQGRHGIRNRPIGHQLRATDNHCPRAGRRCRVQHRKAALVVTGSIDWRPSPIPSSRKPSPSAREVFMTNLSVYLVESADMYPDGPALRCDGTTTTFSELADNAARFAAYLADRGLRPGDRVGVMLANRPEFAMVFYGVLHAGAVVVPMDPLRSAREVEFFLTNTGARLLVFAPSCKPAATAGALAAGVPLIGVGEHTLEQLTSGFLGQAWPVTHASDDNAVILHTSSRTGAPKGAQLTHRNLVSNQAVIASRLLNIGPDDAVLGCLPPSEAFGMTCGSGGSHLGRREAGTASQV